MRGFQAMVDMAKDPSDVKQEMASCMPCAPACDPKVPVYPYGLCISLDEGSLAKMGMEGDLPSVGDMIHLCAMASVTSVSQSERVDENGAKTKCCRIELQITHLATENEDEEGEREMNTQARRGRFYGSVDGSAGKDAA